MPQGDDQPVMRSLSIPVRDSSGGFGFASFSDVGDISLVDATTKTKTQQQRVPSLILDLKREKTTNSVQQLRSPDELVATLMTPTLGSSPHGAPVRDAVAGKSTARYYVDTEDELEFERFRTSSRGGDTDEALTVESEKWVATHASDLDPDAKRRLSRVAVSVWKGIRTDKSAQDALTREIVAGGVGLSRERARELIETMRKSVPDVLVNEGGKGEEGKERGKYEESKESGNDREDKKSEEVKLGKEREEARKDDVVKGDPVNPDASEHRTREGDKGGLGLSGNREEIMKAVPLMTEVRERKPRGGNHTESIRPSRVAPVVRSSQPVGPVDELSMMALGDFRHLSGEAHTAAQKVFQKIDILGDESLSLKVDAIAAWKQSPVYKEYIAVGSRSIKDEVSIKEIISGHVVGEMTMEEFEAISDLNKRLQF